MPKTLLALTLLLLPPLAQAADNPWAGTWKLDVDKSHFTGNTFTYSKTAEGKMHYDDGSTPNGFTFGIDGKPYTDELGDTRTWTAAGPNTWDSVAKRGDTELMHAHRTLSSDGKTYTIVVGGTKPDGTTFANTSVYTRVSGTSGLEGTWRSTKITISSPGLWIISFPTPDTFKWDIPDYKQTITGKMDGSDCQFTGPMTVSSVTVSVTQVSPLKFTSISKNKGQTTGLSEDTLSADGKMITEVSWTPGKESEKQTAIYFKQ